MNYRHVYHAGNFADVVKHAVLARIITYLKQKEAAFRVIDTHAGTGLYDLSSVEAQKTGEWRDGIGKLLAAELPARSAALFAPYLDAVTGFNEGDRLQQYPGSPTLARRLLRHQDRLTAIELHPADSAILKARFEGDWQVRVIELDGWLALGAHLPPKEKRGLVLVDPPFEQEGEFERLADGLIKAHKRWPGGVYALWYPIKDRGAVNMFRERLRAAGIAKVMDISFMVRAPSPEPRLDGTGMIVVNPPYVLAEELAIMLPELHRILAEANTPRPAVTWLSASR
ncbi:23S rRNA (adenine(2030)-N(6))-methyltransferase RlmJ [Mesorhizobium sp. CAU 1741]|uniref:23S rRNA (adenine(2030)-N(6))-methyltransferase RlmJ n=1 Tax=Mesorhizobium sp. CAU 1741 TaxID=3140366 RepID=UPI00325BA3A9